MGSRVDIESPVFVSTGAVTPTIQGLRVIVGYLTQHWVCLQYMTFLWLLQHVHRTKGQLSVLRYCRYTYYTGHVLQFTT